MYHVYTVYTPMNYTPWNPIYSHHYDFKITFEWPPTNWYSIWHIFWHYIWHSSWHIFWHSIWHSFWQIYCDIPSGILFGILSDIYSDILSGILSGKYIVTFHLAFCLAFCLAFYWYIYILTFYLAFYVTYILASIQHCLWHSIWHLISWDVNCRIRGGGGGWGGILGGQDAALIKSRDPEWPWPGRWGKIKSGWWSTYPSEKWWSSSVGMLFHSQLIWKVIQNSMVPVTTNQKWAEWSENLQRQDLRHQTLSRNPFTRLAQRTLKAQDRGRSRGTQGGRTQPGNQRVVQKIDIFYESLMGLTWSLTKKNTFKIGAWPRNIGQHWGY